MGPPNIVPCGAPCFHEAVTDLLSPLASNEASDLEATKRPPESATEAIPRSCIFGSVRCEFCDTRKGRRRVADLDCDICGRIFCFDTCGCRNGRDQRNWSCVDLPEPVDGADSATGGTKDNDEVHDYAPHLAEVDGDFEAEQGQNVWADCGASQSVFGRHYLEDVLAWAVEGTRTTEEQGSQSPTSEFYEFQQKQSNFAGTSTVATTTVASASSSTAAAGPKSISRGVMNASAFRESNGHDDSARTFLARCADFGGRDSANSDGRCKESSCLLVHGYGRNVDACRGEASVDQLHSETWEIAASWFISVYQGNNKKQKNTKTHLCWQCWIRGVLAWWLLCIGMSD